MLNKNSSKASCFIGWLVYEILLDKHAHTVIQCLTNLSKSRYLKEVWPGQTPQENFSINGSDSQYTNISELFSVFGKEKRHRTM